LPPLRSKVEFSPTGVRHYELFMDVISLGYYPHLIKRVGDKIDVQPGHSILDLGSGTGRNDCFIARKIGPDGAILGLDISKGMLSLPRRRCQSYPNAKFKEQRGGWIYLETQTEEA
jgi:ubiquinone/menaquinone biosynthesis C-methylase UbiE